MKKTEQLNFLIFLSLSAAALLCSCNHQDVMNIGDNDKNEFVTVGDFINWDGGLGEVVRNPIVSRGLLEAGREVKRCKEERDNQEFELSSLREQYAKLSLEHKNSNSKVASLQETVLREQKSYEHAKEGLQEEIKDLNAAINTAKADYEAELKQLQDDLEGRVSRARENVRKCRSDKEELSASIHKMNEGWRNMVSKQCPEVEEPIFITQHMGEKSGISKKETYTDLSNVATRQSRWQFEPYNLGGGFVVSAAIFGVAYWYKTREYARTEAKLASVSEECDVIKGQLAQIHREEEETLTSQPRSATTSIASNANR